MASRGIFASLSFILLFINPSAAAHTLLSLQTERKENHLQSLLSRVKEKEDLILSTVALSSQISRAGGGAPPTHLPHKMPFRRCSAPFLLLFFSIFLSAHSLPLSDPHWHPATATWYGSPDGDGSDGGACGYGSLVDVRPLKARVGAVSPVLFKNGEGCGACYKVRCLDKSICSRRAVTVIVTDECPGCAFGRSHFDLSGAAFGRLAVSGESSQLRNRGEISVIFRRTPCKYRGKNIAFHVNEGSTNYWLSLLVEFEDGDGDVGSMQIKEASSSDWLDMRHIWGANWCIIGGPLQGPFSVRLTSLSTQRTLSAREVIPRNWSPKATYTSRLNFTPK